MLGLNLDRLHARQRPSPLRYRSGPFFATLERVKNSGVQVEYDAIGKRQVQLLFNGKDHAVRYSRGKLSL